MHERQQKSRKTKEAQAVSNLFTVMFLTWGIYMMIAVFLHEEDVKNIERAISFRVAKSIFITKGALKKSPPKIWS